MRDSLCVESLGATLALIVPHTESLGVKGGWVVILCQASGARRGVFDAILYVTF